MQTNFCVSNSEFHKMLMSIDKIAINLEFELKQENNYYHKTD